MKPDHKAALKQAKEELANYPNDTLSTAYLDLREKVWNAVKPLPESGCMKALREILE